MITPEELKEYLRIPYDDDDAFIRRIIDTGYGYLEDAIDNYRALYKANERFRNKASIYNPRKKALNLSSIAVTPTYQQCQAVLEDLRELYNLLCVRLLFFQLQDPAIYVLLPQNPLRLPYRAF